MDLNKIVKTKVNDFDFFVFSNDYMGLDFMGGNLWEPHITQFMINELDSECSFVDVGSNYGYHTLFGSKICKNVYSFEPQKEIFELQKKNLESNQITNVKFFNFALGNENKKVSITNYDNSNKFVNVGEVSVILNSDDDTQVEMKKMDDVIFNIVDLIKIDVQGFEKYVIQGSENILNIYNPNLIVEFENYQLGKFQYDAKNLFEYIRSLNYHIFLLDYHYPSDFVCVHKNKLKLFKERNKNFIKEISENNGLNNCLDYGVEEKISYSFEITSNSIKHFKI